jgi:phosphohistidine phosphatase SixA
MSDSLPIVYLARHGETPWTITGQHTGLTDLPLTERGERNARRLGERLKGLTFAKVFTSPLQRARRTCELAGFGAVPSAPGKHFMLTTASLSAVGYEHNLSRPVIRLWNDDHHIGD